MILSLLRHSGWAALVAACGASVACSSTTNPPPDVYVGSNIGPGGNGTQCSSFQSPTPWLVIGTGTGGKPTTVSDQGSNAMGTVQVQCTVHPVGHGFDVSLVAQQNGPSGASLTIESPQGKGAVTPSGASGISATFGSASRGVFRATDCTITNMYMGSGVPVTPYVAAGRIWGHISCPTAQANGQMTVGADGGPTTNTCDAEGDFLFEQCGQ